MPGSSRRSVTRSRYAGGGGAFGGGGGTSGGGGFHQNDGFTEYGCARHDDDCVMGNFFGDASKNALITAAGGCAAAIWVAGVGCVAAGFAGGAGAFIGTFVWDVGKYIWDAWSYAK